MLARGAQIPEDWPADVRASLVATGCAVTVDVAVDVIAAANEGFDEGLIRQQLMNDHGKDVGAELAGSLSARWLAEVEVAVANGYGPPATAGAPVDVDAGVVVKKPKAKG